MYGAVFSGGSGWKPQSPEYGWTVSDRNSFPVRMRGRPGTRTPLTPSSYPDPGSAEMDPKEK
jgi:hypothetical protein